MKPVVAVARGRWWAAALTIEADGTVVAEVSGFGGGRALLGATYVPGTDVLAVTRSIDSVPTGPADIESMLGNPLVYGANPEFVDAAFEGVAIGTIFLDPLTGSLDLTWAATDLHESRSASFTMAGRLLAWVIAQPAVTTRMVKQHLDSEDFRRVPRPLDAGEQRLVDELIRRAGGVVQFDHFDPRPVIAIDGGAAGSLRFLPTAATTFGCVASELSFVDVDGVEVSVALYLDELCHLFELDVSKDDFSPVRSIPLSFAN